MGEDTKKYVQRHKHLKIQRQQWEDQYKDISEYILPRKGFFFDKHANLGDTRASKILSGVASRSMRVLSAGLQGGLTSPSRPWFRLALEKQEIMDNPMVKGWLAKVEKRLRNALSQSNFYQAAHAMYTELGGFGTGCLHIGRGKKKSLHFRMQTVGEYCLAVDAENSVDTIYRELSLTAKQCVEMFDSVSSEVKDLYEKNPYEYVKVVHVVQPNKDRKKGKIDSENKPFESVYYEAERQQHLLRKSGYDTFPFACPRWDTSGADVYGRGPGMDALPDVKMLMAERKSIIKAIQLGVDPPLKASGDMKGRINLLPGAVSYISDGQLEEVIKSRPDIQAALQAYEETKNDIREWFFNDLFLMLTAPQRDVTATEIMERKEEKMLMLGPVVERQHSEFADIVISESLSILMEEEGFPELPPEMMEQIGDYTIEYVSVLAQAQKMAGTQAIQRTAEFAGNLAQGFPDVLDKFDADEALDEFHEMVGAPVQIVKSSDEVAPLREQRQAEAEQQKQAEQAMIQQQMATEQANQQGTAVNTAKTAIDGLQGASQVDVEKLMQNVQGIQ